jgi:aryl sulfotransferase
VPSTVDGHRLDEGDAMSTRVNEVEPAGPPAGPPPWLEGTIQQKIVWRDGDIVVSVPPKSGTTWTMNIVHQLRSGGDPSFADIYAEVPWLEILPSPDSVVDDLVAGFDQMPHDRRRAFKSHAAPPALPFHASGSGLDVRYVVVVRHPDEAVASFRPFIAAHSDAWFDLWQVPSDAIVGPNFEAFFAGLGSHAIAPMVFGVVAAWWQLRNEPNVLLVHYSDLKRQPEASIRKIAEFLDFEVTEAQWPAILEYTSFAWMKAHEDKFELRSVSEVPILDPGAMIRKGQIGASAEDGITPEISEAIAAIGRTIVTDPAAFHWCYHGGNIAT